MENHLSHFCTMSTPKYQKYRNIFFRRHLKLIKLNVSLLFKHSRIHYKICSWTQKGMKFWQVSFVICLSFKSKRKLRKGEKCPHCSGHFYLFNLSFKMLKDSFILCVSPQNSSSNFFSPKVSLLNFHYDRNKLQLQACQNKIEQKL